MTSSRFVVFEAIDGDEDRPGVAGERRYGGRRPAVDLHGRLQHGRLLDGDRLFVDAAARGARSGRDGDETERDEASYGGTK
jgi:hypothetical protein